MPRRPTPEEEWIGGEESQGPHVPGDPTHSPYEGDIPPWGQRTYSGEFPMEGRVFYVNGYAVLLKHQGLGIYLENLDRFGMTHGVGEFPKELQFGSDFSYAPFAAIPIRHEDRGMKDFFFKYLERLAKQIKLTYLRIIVEGGFPKGEPVYDDERTLTDIRGQVVMPGQRWFQYSTMKPFSNPMIEYVNAHVVNRFYGGGEEGGWWYDGGVPLASIPHLAGGQVTAQKWKDHLQNSIGWHSKYKLDSVLGHDEFRVSFESHFAEEWPGETPHYE